MLDKESACAQVVGFRPSLEVCEASDGETKSGRKGWHFPKKRQKKEKEKDADQEKVKDKDQEKERPNELTKAQHADVAGKERRAWSTRRACIDIPGGCVFAGLGSTGLRITGVQEFPGRSAPAAPSSAHLTRNPWGL